MWNGSATRSIDDNFYRRRAWKKCRASFIKNRDSIDGGMCQRCGVNPGKIVHHRIPLTSDTINDPDICYGFHNLEYVCLDCHNLEHGYKKQIIGVKYSFDPEGNPIVR